MKPTRELLEHVTPRVLENSAFIFAQPVEAPPDGFNSTGDDSNASSFGIAGTINDAIPSFDEIPSFGDDEPDDAIASIDEPGAPEEDLYAFDKTGNNTPAPDDPAGDSDTPSKSPIVGVRLDYNGYLDGYCEIWTTRELTKVLAANMLGIMDDNTDAIDRTCVDALKETLNILCGNILTEMAGDEPQFNLGPPQELEKLDDLPDSDTAKEIWLDVEGQSILFRLQIDSPAEGAA